jgi:metallo-beta-lactamase family protein
MAELEFHGAAGTVTGSMHLVHLKDGTVALDCGLFQGKRALARQINESFPLPPRELQGLLLSHAHIDHSGNIPGLVRQGFAGPIWATGATCDLCNVMLLDSAHIQEEDAEFWNRKRARSKAEMIAPLYTVDDAAKAATFFKPTAYNEPVAFAPGCTAKFIEAGHILGSACVLIEISQSTPIRLLFTGDLGRFGEPILRDPTCPLPPVDYLITESTYADRRHGVEADMKAGLVKLIQATRAQGGKVIIPAFSVGRTQTIAYYLQQAVADGTLPPLPIFVDSPLSSRATEVFRKHSECYDAEATAFWHEQGDVFGRGLVKYITTVDESKALNTLGQSCVILSASGMCESGRILHHLKNNIEDARNAVAIVGYMAQDTLGRRIAERQSEVKIFGRMYKLRAQVQVFDGFSAHADSADLARLLDPLAPGLKAAFAVHGEGGQLTAMKSMLEGAGCRNVHIPAPGERFAL